MSVDPLKGAAAESTRQPQSLTPRRPDVASTGEGRSGHTPAESADQPQSADQVQLSAASRTLVQRADEADRVPEGTIAPERMRDVLRRLESGHYDSDEVRATIALRARQDLGLPNAE
jgi:hypothetical protein